MAEQVQSAEFAMSTFSILNNQTHAAAVDTDENRTIQDEDIPEPTTVQRHHILSGTRELKQSNSVLTGADAKSQNIIEAAENTLLHDAPLIEN